MRGFGPSNFSMNSFVTYTARAKLLSLLGINSPILINTFGTRLTIEFGPESEITHHLQSAIMINMMPQIYATVSALKSLTDASVDFDYNTHDFILTAGQ